METTKEIVKLETSPAIVKLITKDVLLTDIIPDPNQPRKYFDEAEMTELTNSVLEKGVLQRALLRPVKGKPGKYMVVVGERRYRASVRVMAIHKHRNTLPADIREISDEEALELQIIENLQRKNVSPMEEATAFQSLNKKGMTNVEIGKRVGKSEFYIRQRLKLNHLIKEWQEALYAHRIDITDAIKLAAIDPVGQKDIWDDEAKSGDEKIIFDDWAFDDYRGDLNGAPFDTTDETLNKKMGACGGCQYNTAAALLFPDDEKSPRCLNIACFKGKCDTSFAIEFKLAQDDADILFVNPEHNAVMNDITKAVQKTGLPFINGRWHQGGGYQFNILARPDKPDLEDFEGKNRNLKNRDELLAAFAKSEGKYEKDLEAYTKAIASGKYTKAFSINGSSKGIYLYIQVIKNVNTTGAGGTGPATSSAAVKVKAALGKLTEADITGEVIRIRERLARGAVLDLHKVHVATLEAFNKRSECSSSKPKMMAMQKQDRGLLVYLLVEMIGTHNVVAGMPRYSTSKDKYNVEYFDQLSKTSDLQLALLIRVAVKKKWGSVNLQYGLHTSDTTVRIIAQYLGIDIKKIEAEVKVGADKRIASANKKIEELNKAKAELKKPAVAKEKIGEAPAAKKAAPAKQAKKAAPKKAAKKK